MSRTPLCALLLALCAAGSGVAADAAVAGRPFSLTPEAAAKALAAAAPVNAAENAFQGGQTLALRGMYASDSVSAHLALVNLAKTTNRCTLALADANGASLGQVVSLTLERKETRPDIDAFKGLVSRLTETAARVSCDKAFSAYALVADGDTGRLDTVAPELSADALALPTKVPTCPTGALCFDAPGVDHIPEPPPGMAVGRVSFDAPPGIANRLRATVDVTVGPWYPKDPSGKHLIYWFVVSKNIDMPGLLYFLGPNKSEAFARHGIGLTHPQKIKVIKKFKAKVGHTYHVDNDYDMAGGTYRVTITDKTPGGAGTVLVSKPNVTSYTIKPASKFLFDMGFNLPGADNPGEVPSYGWKYANVHIEAYLKH
jgi:hypothetical protein